jgi:hypothetical protein
MLLVFEKTNVSVVLFLNKKKQQYVQGRERQKEEK